MKRKYYLRGLGIGVLITTLVFSFLPSDAMSDEDIIKRAEELGYQKVESQATPGLNLDELKNHGTPSPTESPATLTPTQIPDATPTVLPTETPVPTTVPQKTPSPAPTTVPQETPSPAPTAVPQKTPSPVPTVTASEDDVIKAEIHITPGSSLSQVCKMIQEAGIVKDWEELRMYIKNNGLMMSINVGRFTLSSDMTYAEIAFILTGQQVEE